MDSQQIKDHWADWATKYGTSSRATTMVESAKALETDALYRWIRGICIQDEDVKTVLEVGCGNGINCIRLAKRFPEMRFYGVDYSEEMISLAKELAKTEDVLDRTRFVVADLLDLHSVIKIDQQYDIVFTDRCLINLETLEKQAQAIEVLAMKVHPDGHLLMIENSRQARE